jgi:hypothetical protein
LERKIAEAGFSITFSTSYTAFLLPFMAVSRLLPRRRGRQQRSGLAAAGYEFEVAPVLNAVFRFLAEIEVALAARGVRWPAGGSRVVVAHKPV